MKPHLCECMHGGREGGKESVLETQNKDCRAIKKGGNAGQSIETLEVIFMYIYRTINLGVKVIIK